MTHKRSYKIKQFSTDVQGEVDRLKAQVDLFWEKEIRCYRQFGLTDGMSILECGSGPGYVTEKILNEFPNCTSTAIEIDSYLVAILKCVAEKRKIKVSQQSVTQLGFKDNCFDFVITRLVLEHLPEPEEAVWEINRVLKPGGIAVFVDNDFEMHLKTFPGIPEINTLYEAYCKSRISEGGNPKIGRQLPNLLKQCGFKNVDMEIICAHNSLVGDDIFLKSEGVGIPAKLVKDGFLDSRILDKLAVKWHQVLKADDHAIYRQLFVAGGEKIETANAGCRSIENKKERQGSIDSIHLISNDATNSPEKTDLTAKRIESMKSRTDIVDYIRRLIAQAFRMEENDILPGSRFIDLGLDSLMAVDVISTIESELGILLSLMDFFEGQSIADLAEKIEYLSSNATTHHDEDFLKMTHGIADQESNTVMVSHISKTEPVEWEEGEI
ncbi:MAG: methyltransferase domain-containing protein [Desulfobacteraceae bacterium]|jgi:ubiquinone/menaquinone biosynthesis C-methylase UbiE/acyl carrier protein